MSEEHCKCSDGLLYTYGMPWVRYNTIRHEGMTISRRELDLAELNHRTEQVKFANMFPAISHRESGVYTFSMSEENDEFRL